MALVSLAVNRQSMLAAAVLRSDTQALAGLLRLSKSALRPRRQVRASTSAIPSAGYGQDSASFHAWEYE